MASDQTTDLILRLEELENRVRVLEDTDAIRNLKARYAAYCDDNYNPDKIAELFVEDAVWESGPLEVWPESHWPGFALREADVFKTYMAWWCM